MTIRELIEYLETFDSDMPVVTGTSASAYQLFELKRHSMETVFAEKAVGYNGQWRDVTDRERECDFPVLVIR